MKIKSVKNCIDKPNKWIFNSDLRHCLSIGSIFWVYGLNFSKSITYFYIFFGTHLIQVPSELFEIIDDSVPNEWKIKIWEYGDVTLWPSLFYEEGFLENFSEHETRERALFEELRKKIELQ